MKQLKQKNSVTVTLLCIFALCFGLVIVRWINIFNPAVCVINQSINSHITNFTLSVLLCVLIGYFLLLYGKRFRWVCLVGLLLLLANFIYELCLPILNTTDPIDAIYGLAGVLISLAYLYWMSKFGFEKE